MKILDHKYLAGIGEVGPEENCECEQCGEVKPKGQYCELWFCNDDAFYAWEEEAIICEECLEKY